MASSRCGACFFCEAPAFEVEYGLDGRVPREGEDVFLDDEEIDGLDGEGPYRFVAERVGWQFGKRGLEEAIVKLATA